MRLFKLSKKLQERYKQIPQMVRFEFQNGDIGLAGSNSPLICNVWGDVQKHFVSNAPGRLLEVFAGYPGFLQPHLTVKPVGHCIYCPHPTYATQRYVSNN